jgi:hypothetical protein
MHERRYGGGEEVETTIDIHTGPINFLFFLANYDSLLKRRGKK